MVFFKFEYYLDSNNKFDRFGENKATDFEIGCINKIMLKAHPILLQTRRLVNQLSLNGPQLFK